MGVYYSLHLYRVCFKVIISLLCLLILCNCHLNVHWLQNYFSPVLAMNFSWLISYVFLIHFYVFFLLNKLTFVQLCTDILDFTIVSIFLSLYFKKQLIDHLSLNISYHGVCNWTDNTQNRVKWMDFIHDLLHLVIYTFL